MNDNSIEIFYANGTIYRKVEEIFNEPEHELTPEAEQALKEKAKRNNINFIYSFGNLRRIHF
jgi:hypothetical protein